MRVKPALLPQVRKDGLEVQEIEGEVLVYDLERHRAHSLNEAAALVWRHCDGKTSLGEMARILQRELDAPADEVLVRLALRRLERAHLLSGSPSFGKDETARRSRREWIKKLGLAASAMLPMVSTIVSPTPAEAASCIPFSGCAGVADCTPCSNPGSNNCNANFRCCGGKCLPPGQAKQCGC